MKILVSEEHLKNALEGYLKALSMIEDDDIILSVKRDRHSGDYEVEIERE